MGMNKELPYFTFYCIKSGPPHEYMTRAISIRVPLFLFAWGVRA